MDQLKVVQKHLGEHGFWYSCGAILLVGLVTWFFATQNLVSAANTEKGKIEGQFNNAAAVQRQGNQIDGASKPYHPNDGTHEQTAKQIEILAASVKDAWNEHFAQQGERIFVWPKTLAPDFLAQIDRITKTVNEDGKSERIPIEKVIPYGAPDNHPNNLDIKFRTTYGLFIERELPKLAERIRSNWLAVEEGQRPVVSWNPTNQQHLLKTRFDWSTQEDDAPTTLQVLYAQEDLRVLEALMDIIAKTNSDATADYDATIKFIESIDLGRDAAQTAGSILKLGARAGADDGNTQGGPFSADGGDDGGGDGFGGGDDLDGGGGDLDGGGGFDDGGGGGNGDDDGGDDDTKASLVAGDDPADLRYVDLNYDPLSASKLRESFDKKDPELARLAVAKRLPVRMRLTIDQRKIHRLLTECGNSPLTVEVRQVRVNPGSSSSRTTSGGGFSSNQGGGGFGGFGGAGGDTSGGGFDDFGESNNNGGGGGGSAPSAGQKNKNNQFDVTIELYGIVYIYNPVDDDKFPVVAEEASAAEPADS